jgi:hypothetical protein
MERQVALPPIELRGRPQEDETMNASKPLGRTRQGSHAGRRSLCLGAALLGGILAASAAAAFESDAPRGKMLSWDAERSGSPAQYRIGGLHLTLSSKMVNGSAVPALHVDVPGGPRFDLLGREGFPHVSADFGAGPLDADSRTDGIIFTTYTGGAHCCTGIQILELIGGQWRTVDLGDWDGSGIGDFPKDIDGNGFADLVLADDRFAYAFTFYAASRMPPRIFEIHDGAAVDVSASGHYDALFQHDLDEARGPCLMHDNGACAAYVADAARLGNYADAWRLMLANYDAKSTWDYPAKCNTTEVNGQCPKGAETKFANFPDALQWFLADKGYIKTP